jgi:hypothetical protein
MAEPTLFKNAKAAWATGTATGATLTQISDVKSVALPLTKAELANSVMSDDGETFFPGLISAPITVVARQSFATGSTAVDQQAYDRWNGGDKFRFEFAPVNAALSATNPAYHFSRVGVFSFTPINGAHGELLENSIEMRMLSGCVLSRKTA